MKKYLLIALIGCVMTTPALAQENWTEVGMYVFISDIQGDVRVGDVTYDVDVSFSDILDNLDIGFTGFVEHRRGKWSLIVDLAYLKISQDQTISRTPDTSVKLDAEGEQAVVDALIGYRVFEQDQGEAQFGLDLLGGLRYNKVAFELDTSASLFGTTESASLNPDENWADAVIAARVQYGHDNGWGVIAWADISDGSDSSSSKVMGIVSYRFKINITVYGGYRLFNLEKSGDSRGYHYDLDLDYSGPIMGVSYRF